MLFEFNPGSGIMQATSGFGLDELRTEPWVPVEEEGALVAEAFARRGPTLVVDARRQMPELTARLGSRLWAARSRASSVCPATYSWTR